jgi:single-strand DNA-binding protein
MTRTRSTNQKTDAAEMLGTTVAKVGNLTRAPELRTAASGVDYATFGLAVDRPVVPGDWSGHRETSFYDVVCFGTLAANAAASLRKGTRVVVAGRTETRADETAAGEIRTVVRIVADAVGPELRWARATLRRQRPGAGSGGHGVASQRRSRR